MKVNGAISLTMDKRHELIVKCTDVLFSMAALLMELEGSQSSRWHAERYNLFISVQKKP